MDGLTFSGGGMIFSLYQIGCTVGAHDDLVPAKALAAMQLDSTLDYEYLAVNALLLKDLDMDVQLAMPVKAVGGE